MSLQLELTQKEIDFFLRNKKYLIPEFNSKTLGQFVIDKDFAYLFVSATEPQLYVLKTLRGILVLHITGIYTAPSHWVCKYIPEEGWIYDLHYRCDFPMIPRGQSSAMPINDYGDVLIERAGEINPIVVEAMKECGRLLGYPELLSPQEGMLNEMLNFFFMNDLLEYRSVDDIDFKLTISEYFSGHQEYEGCFCTGKFIHLGKTYTILLVKELENFVLYYHMDDKSVIGAFTSCKNTSDPIVSRLSKMLNNWLVDRPIYPEYSANIQSIHSMKTVMNLTNEYR